ncbi:hypothetical protein [Chiayiivirga flava]|uniref:Histidine kinase n=1 Tax=Chiayiivirga flava TaxID=659595 RepID=A0A7W8D8E7_9GAMM|nr:hypothetical protein [Chiayiivirga flava]MBB5208501.1 hypothetical protein [Chiayiivirga flava]
MNLPSPLLLLLLLSASLLAAPASAADKADPLVKRHLEARGTPYEVDEDNDYAITVDMGDGRTQLVYVMSNVHRVDGLAVREIWSNGYQSLEKGMLPAKVANRLLEHSHEVILGSWVKQGDGYAVFVVKIPADASADQLDSAIDTAAASADLIEKEFTGETDAF